MKEIASKQEAVTTAKDYVRPSMVTIVTPREIRDIDQPCAFYEPKPKDTTPSE